MNFFTIRLSKDIDDFLKKLLIQKESVLTITDLNQNYQYIEKDSVFFLYVKGGKSSSEWWISNPDYRGTLFIATLKNAPVFYSDKNYKIDVEIRYRFQIPITQEKCIRYPDTYNTEIGPKTKGSQTQAIALLQDETQIFGILRAALIYNPESEFFLKDFFKPDYFKKIIEPKKVFIEKVLTYTEDLNELHKTDDFPKDIVVESVIVNTLAPEYNNNVLAEKFQEMEINLDSLTAHALFSFKYGKFIEDEIFFNSDIFKPNTLHSR